MKVRSLALVLGAALVGCASQKSETAEPVSTTQTTSAPMTVNTIPNEPYDPHFRVSDPIYESCQLASRRNLDVAQGTAYCMKSGALMDKRIRILGEKSEIVRARGRLMDAGVDPSRIITIESGGPAYVEIVQDFGSPSPVNEHPDGKQRR